jgi:hypothetical protein
MKKRIRVSQLMARVKAGGKALENLPVTSPLRVQDLDGRPPGASVMGEQKLLPSSLPEKRYPYSHIRGSLNKPVLGQVQELTICPIKDYDLHTLSVLGRALLEHYCQY